MTTRFRCVECNKTVFFCVKEKWTRKLIEFFHYNRLFTEARSTVLKNRGKGGGNSHHICYNFYLYVKFIFNFFTLPKTGKARYMKISFYIQNLRKMSISKKSWGTPLLIFSPILSVCQILLQLTIQYLLIDWLLQMGVGTGKESVNN